MAQTLFTKINIWDSPFGFAGTVPQFSYNSKYQDTYLTGHGSLKYNFTDDLIGYASVSRGYLSGGLDRFNNNAPSGLDPITIDPSTSWAYEGGAKFASADGRFALSGNLFFNDVGAGQLQTFDAATAVFVRENQDYVSNGFELEGSAEIGSGTSVFGGVGFTRTRVGEVAPDSNSGAVKGNEVPNVPELTASFGVENRLPIAKFAGGGDVVSRLGYQYTGDRAADMANSFDLEEAHMLDASIGWEGEYVGVDLFAKNLLNERYQSLGLSFATNANSAVIGPGRLFGIRASVEW